MAPSSRRDESFALIVLLGMTGAGKTTFARAVSGNDSLQVGHSIYPCTQDPQEVKFTFNGRPVVLIDTPGFDDDSRTDVQILEDIAKWLAMKGYLDGKNQLDGLILLHPVTMHRLGGSERRRTRLLQNLLGPNAFKRVIIATTMWERLKDENDKGVKDGLDGRQKDVWYDLVSKGAKVRKHYNNPESARCIIKEIIELSQKYGKLEPLIQTELARDPHLVKTTAGRSMEKDLTSDIERTKALLMEHDGTKPKVPGRRDEYMRNRRWKEYREWEEERRTLQKRLERLESSLAKLSGFHWGRFFSSIFSFGR